MVYGVEFFFSAFISISCSSLALLFVVDHWLLFFHLEDVSVLLPAITVVNIVALVAKIPPQMAQ